MGNLDILLRGLHTTLTLPRTHPAILWRDCGWGGGSDIWEDTELWLQSNGWRESHNFPCVEPSPRQPNLNFHWPGELCSLHTGDSLGLFPTNLHNTSDFFVAGRQLMLVRAPVFLGQLLGLHTPHGWRLALVCSETLAEWT